MKFSQKDAQEVLQGLCKRLFRKLKLIIKHFQFFIESIQIRYKHQV